MTCRVHTTLHVHIRFLYSVLDVTTELIAHSLSFFFSFFPVPICRTSIAATMKASMETFVSMWRWLVVIGLFTLVIVLFIIYRCMLVCYPDTEEETSEQDIEPA